MNEPDANDTSAPTTPLVRQIGWIEFARFALICTAAYCALTYNGPQSTPTPLAIIVVPCEIYSAVEIKHKIVLDAVAPIADSSFMLVIADKRENKSTFGLEGDMTNHIIACRNQTTHLEVADCGAFSAVPVSVSTGIVQTTQADAEVVAKQLLEMEAMRKWSADMEVVIGNRKALLKMRPTISCHDAVHWIWAGNQAIHSGHDANNWDGWRYTCMQLCDAETPRNAPDPHPGCYLMSPTGWDRDFDKGTHSDEETRVIGGQGYRCDVMRGLCVAVHV